jgi:hypothetical protein
MATKQWQAENVGRMRRYRRDWYEKNKDRAKGSVKRRRREIRDWLKTAKADLRCSRCQESHVACLDFHHRERTEKEIAVALVIQQGWSMKRILEEIAKCEVLCSNCHRREHFDHAE